MEEAAESKRPRAKALNKASRKASPMLEPRISVLCLRASLYMYLSSQQGMYVW